MIGQGSPFYSTVFLNAIADSVSNAIRSAELRLLPQDFGSGNRAIEGAGDDSAHGIACLKSELSDIWWYKFTAISDLHLDHLHLDFTKAYSPDGTFLGNASVQIAQPFSRGVPANLEIVATDITVAENLRAIILARNPQIWYVLVFPTLH